MTFSQAPTPSSENQTQLIQNAAELNTDPRQSKQMPLALKALMVKPTFFNVENPINPHMRKADGTLHALNFNKVQEQWTMLHDAYLKIGIPVLAIDGQPGKPDMVFCANQSLPIVDNSGNKLLLLSNMHNDIRHSEVPFIAESLISQQYKLAHLPARSSETLFEAMGDCLWLPGKRFLLGGYGHRTTKAIYNYVSQIAQAPVALFELVNPRFYHLDTCLSIINDDTAIAHESAFTEPGLKLLNKIFPNLIPVTLKEADSPGFACNAHCPDGKHVLIQQGNVQINSVLQKAGFTVVELPTDEFIKSGGSVFCMKLMYF